MSSKNKKKAAAAAVRVTQTSEADARERALAPRVLDEVLAAAREMEEELLLVRSRAVPVAGVARSVVHRRAA